MAGVEANHGCCAMKKKLLSFMRLDALLFSYFNAVTCCHKYFVNDELTIIKQDVVLHKERKVFIIFPCTESNI